MKTLNQYINEHIVGKITHYNPDLYTSKHYTCKPKNFTELTKEIVKSFKEAEKNNETYVDLNYIDVSNVDKMNSLFNYAFHMSNTNIKKVNISEWDVSNVTSMNYMFSDLTDFDCGDISKWDVSKVNTMEGMFFNCYKFNSDLSNWNVSNVDFVQSMFLNCEEFNCDLSKWNTSSFIDAASMFKNCKNFDGDVSNWDIENIGECSSMFNGCSSFTGKGLETWKTGDAVNRAVNMFYNCKRLKKIPSWYK